nr:PREDICTED: zinc finger CCHC domain-containing protein 3-like [Latimeria chalumnae]|eukprot:XP_014351271.1 PREDICTED: zinc finger CCHC domain-containing protein 3-like [Latimeria chalumnae]
MSAESDGLPLGQAALEVSPAVTVKDWGEEMENEANEFEGIEVLAWPSLDPASGETHGKGGKNIEPEVVKVLKENVSKPSEANKDKARKSLYADILKKRKEGNRKDGNTGERPDPSRIDYRRKNVVRLYYTGESIPDRDVVAKDIIIVSLQFTPLHIFAFIHISGSRDFDLSFRNVVYLDLFWARYEKVKYDLVWKDFKVIKISENNSRLITILFKSESVPASDISFWLKNCCQQVGHLKPIYDQNGFWVGGYKLAVKLCSDNSGLHHLPNFVTIGRDRGYFSPIKSIEGALKSKGPKIVFVDYKVPEVPLQ